MDTTNTTIIERPQTNHTNDTVSATTPSIMRELAGLVVESTRKEADIKIEEEKKVISNLVEIEWPNEPIDAYEYTITIKKNHQRVTKPAEVVELFWKFYDTSNGIFPGNTKFVFDDVNTLYAKSEFSSYQKFWTVLTTNKTGEPLEFELEYMGIVKLDQNAESELERRMFENFVILLYTQRIRQNKHVCNHQNRLFSQKFSVKDKTIDVVVPAGFGIVQSIGLEVNIVRRLSMSNSLSFTIVSEMFYRADTPVILLFLELIRGRPLDSTKCAQYLNDLNARNFNEKQINKIEKFFQKLLVKACIFTNEDVMFEITKITRQAAKDLTIKNDDGEMPLVEQYASFGVNVLHPELPCLEYIKKDGHLHYVPIEFVKTVATPQKFDGQLANTKIQSKNVTYSPTNCSKILESLVFVGNQDVPPLLYEFDAWGQEFNIFAGRHFTTFPTTILQPPSLLFGNQRFRDDTQTGKWSMVNESGVKRCVATMRCPDNRRKRLFVAVVRVIDSPETSTENFDYSQMCYLLNSLESMGQLVQRNENNQLQIVKGSYQIDPSQSIKDMRKTIQAIKSTVLKDRKCLLDDVEPTILVCCVIPDNLSKTGSDNLIGVLKYLCIRDIGVHFQPILQSEYFNIRSDYSNCLVSQRVCSAILAKIGSTLFWVEPLCENKNWTKLTSEEEPTLVLGMDVSNDSNYDGPINGDRSLSIMSLVGNVDFRISKFGETVAPLEHGSLSYDGLDDLISARIHKFMEYSHCRPAHIVVFRKDIYDVEKKKGIMSSEIAAVKAACEEIASTYSPTITYITFDREHKMMIMPSGKSKTIKIGSVVETESASDDECKFYLYTGSPHDRMQLPTHYHVCCDEWQPNGRCFWESVIYGLTANSVLLRTTLEVPCVIQYAELSSRHAHDRLKGHQQMRRQLKLPFDVKKFVEDPVALHSLMPHPNIGDLFWC